VALGADDVEAARPGRGLRRLRALRRLDLDHVFRLQHDLAKTLDVGLDKLDLLSLLGLVGDACGLVHDPHFKRAAELDVGTAAGHVGRDRDRAGHAGLRDDVGFLFVEARIQHREQLCGFAGAGRGVELLHRVFVAEIDLFVAVLFQVFGEDFGLFDRGGADQHRLQPGIGAFHLGQDRGVFLDLGAIDLVVFVEPRHQHIGRNFHDLELVDVEQFVGFGQRRAGHAGELFVHPEIVLERDRGQRLVFRLNLHVLLGFQRLVQAFRIAPALHHAPGELVDDDHLIVADDVVLVALEQRMRAQRLVDVVDDRDVLDVVERIALELAGVAQQGLDLFHAGFGQRHRALLLVDIVIGLVELGKEGVDGVVEFRTVVERTGDDQRRARLVDQDRVDLVDDGVEMTALDHVLEPVLHVVAQIVKTVFVVGAVGDVAGIGILALGVVEAVDDHTDREAEEIVDLPHPFGVAPGEVVVDGDDVDALAGQCVEVDRERRDQRLAFAGLHLGDIAFVQHHAADHLHVEMALAERALGRLAHGGEGRSQNVVERHAVCKLFAEFASAGLQRFVREGGDLRLKRVDGIDAGLIPLDPPVIGGTEKLAGERADHTKFLSLRFGVAAVTWSTRLLINSS
jgi:hypothetical protein